MSEHQIDIADMQCWVFRMAQAKWESLPKPARRYFRIMMCLDLLPDAMIFSI